MTGSLCYDPTRGFCQIFWLWRSFRLWSLLLSRVLLIIYLCFLMLSLVLKVIHIQLRYQFIVSWQFGCWCAWPGSPTHSALAHLNALARSLGSTFLNVRLTAQKYLLQLMATGTEVKSGVHRLQLFNTTAKKMNVELISIWNGGGVCCWKTTRKVEGDGHSYPYFKSNVSTEFFLKLFIIIYT